MFLNNEYPNGYFSKTLEKFYLKNSSSVQSDNDNVREKYRLVLKIPFIGEASYKFRNQIVSLLNSALDVEVCPVFVSFKISNYFSLKCKTPFPYKFGI